MGFPAGLGWLPALGSKSGGTSAIGMGRELRPQPKQDRAEVQYEVNIVNTDPGVLVVARGAEPVHCEGVHAIHR